VLDWAAVGPPLTAFVWVRTGGPDCAGVQATMTTLALSSLHGTMEAPP
jgi:hypothetical protein